MTIGFIGLGAMGARMARRLVAAGHDVTVWNRTTARAEPLAAAGAHVAASAAEAASVAELVITVVTDAAALREVTEGKDGALAGLRPGTVLVDMSTVGPRAIHELAGHLPDGVGCVDAPVLGSISEAEEGSLRIFVGGEDEFFAKVAPVLEVLGKPMHVGGLGSGAAAKLVANSTLFAVLCGLGEAIALGEGLGLSRSAVFDVLAATPLAAQAERRRAMIEESSYAPRFKLSLARKDAELVRDAAREAGVEVRLADAARSWLADAERAGKGELDYSAVLTLLLGGRAAATHAPRDP
jgi:3-hydroxyisobutyrate dehydrogenase-like beta-hydroxyacid dehydrogenase